VTIDDYSASAGTIKLDQLPDTHAPASQQTSRLESSKLYLEAGRLDPHHHHTQQAGSSSLLLIVSESASCVDADHVVSPTRGRASGHHGIAGQDRSTSSRIAQTQTFSKER
jgi:hypothetical protein